MKVIVPVEEKSLSTLVCIYKAQAISVKENIERYKEEKLSLLTEIYAGFHNHGGK